MLKVFRAMGLSIGSLFSFQLLFVLMLPTVLVSGAWIFFLYKFFLLWNESLVNFLLHSWIVDFLKGPLETFTALTMVAVMGWFSVIILVVVLLPLIYGTHLMIFTIFVLPLVLQHLWKKNYPEINKKKNGLWIKSFFKTIGYFSIYLFLYFLFLPLWLIPGVQVILPVALNSYLLKKTMCEDIFSEFCTKEEQKYLQVSEDTPLTLMSIFMSILSLVPIVQLLSPLMAALGFSHLCFGIIKEHRENNISFSSDSSLD